MSNSIFREVALERLSTPEQLDQAMRVTSPMAWLGLVVLALVIAAAIGWGFIGIVPVRVDARGILINPGGVLEVVSSVQGRITQFLVKPDDWVEKGQEIALVAQPQLENDLTAAKAELAQAQDEYQRLVDFQQREAQLNANVTAEKRAALAQRTASLSAQLNWLQERQAAENKLQQQGLIKQQQVIDTDIDINNVKNDQASALDDAKQLDLSDSTYASNQEKARLDQQNKIADLQLKVNALVDQLQRSTHLISPYSGYVVEFAVNAGDVVDAGRALFSMLPEDHRLPDVNGRAHPINLIADFYVAPEDGKRVHPGMQVEISPVTVKQEEYGFILGTVVSVASIPSTEVGIMRVLQNQQLVNQLTGGGAPFEVTVDLALDPRSNDGYRWSSSVGPVTEINPGTLADGSITISQVHLISLAIPALQKIFDPQTE